MKRPCFLFVSYPFGGIENFVRNLQTEISKRDDIESHWLFVEWAPGERIASLPIVGTNWTLKGGLVARSRIQKLEESGTHFDAVFFNSVVGLPLLGECARRTPVVLSLDATPRLLAEHREWWNPERRRGGGQHARHLKTYVTSRAYAKARYLFPWSGIVSDSLVSDYHVGEEKIKEISPGIDLRLWSKSAAHPADGPSGSSTRGRILFVGGEFERKGGDMLLKVAQRTEFQDCEFHIVTRSALPPQGANIRVHNNVPSNSCQLLAHYDQADVFVLPTRADFAPTNVIMEAMAMELPVISTDVGGLDRVVLDGNTGFVVPVDNEDVFAERLQRLVSSRTLRHEFGRNGRARVEAAHDIRHSAIAIINWMKEAARL
jgi:glycosyltransferase involved in cell wall biosynthesis